MNFGQVTSSWSWAGGFSKMPYRKVCHWRMSDRKVRDLTMLEALTKCARFVSWCYACTEEVFMGKFSLHCDCIKVNSLMQGWKLNYTQLFMSHQETYKLHHNHYSLWTFFVLEMSRFHNFYSDIGSWLRFTGPYLLIGVPRVSVSVTSLFACSFVCYVIMSCIYQTSVSCSVSSGSSMAQEAETKCPGK